ncbi:hypothetical protein Sinac_1229 [Singulisphaera acidiphila DSM 18658]|uniref:Uncharacterized protein n=1 Tax=Singulisphaera acidiphila (strain ATCC BAA-1392 / DSM 18658 / VKM B-2454 / MOB10) TaxID=886293 RepID=L0D9V4_SINAD|nr:hypothetical protein Sinac_1229 [Singulisphaera acidiphila DSM 18658]
MEQCREDWRYPHEYAWINIHPRFVSSVSVAPLLLSSERFGFSRTLDDKWAAIIESVGEPLFVTRFSKLSVTVYR